MLANLVFAALYAVWVWKLFPPEDPRFAQWGSVLILTSVLVRFISVLARRRLVKLFTHPPQKCPRCKGPVEPVQHGLLRKGMGQVGKGLYGVVRMAGRLYGAFDSPADMKTITLMRVKGKGDGPMFDELVCKECGRKLIARPRWTMVIAQISSSLLVLSAVTLLGAERLWPGLADHLPDLERWIR